MRNEFLRLAAVAALLFGLGQTARAVVNGGFETGDFTGWTVGGNTGFSGVNAGAAHSGSFGASFGAVGSETELLQIGIPTTPFASYSLEFWLSNLSGLTTNSFSVWRDGVEISDLSLFNSEAFEYKSLSHTFVATGATTTIEFRFRHDPSFWYFDDVSITPTGVPDGAATVVLLGAALCMIYGIRRKLR